MIMQLKLIDFDVNEIATASENTSIYVLNTQPPDLIVQSKE